MAALLLKSALDLDMRLKWMYFIFVRHKIAAEGWLRVANLLSLFKKCIIIVFCEDYSSLLEAVVYKLSPLPEVAGMLS